MYSTYLQLSDMFAPQFKRVNPLQYFDPQRIMIESPEPLVPHTGDMQQMLDDLAIAGGNNAQETNQ